MITTGVKDFENKLYIELKRCGINPQREKDAKQSLFCDQSDRVCCSQVGLISRKRNHAGNPVYQYFLVHLASQSESAK